jgi:hypothetical protein
MDVSEGKKKSSGIFGKLFG